jgi:membrane protein involved in colicin uptake
MRAPDSSECVFGRSARIYRNAGESTSAAGAAAVPCLCCPLQQQRGTPMAKKARKKAGKKSTKKSVAKSKKSAKSKAKKKSPAKKRSAAKKRKKPAAKGIGARVTSAYRTVVDTFTGTDQLRNKMEQKGTSESE